MDYEPPEENSFRIEYDESSADWMKACKDCVNFWNAGIVERSQRFSWWEQHCKTTHSLSKRTHKGNGAFQGAFAFTLTKSPDDDLTEFDMIKAVRKVMNQKSIPVFKYAWYLEYGDPEEKKHPHIHGLYETQNGGRIEAKHFKRAWKIWDEKTRLGKGFRGGYHRPIRSEEAYADYIRKDAGKCEWNNCLIE